MPDLPAAVDPIADDIAAVTGYMLVSAGGKRFALPLGLIREVVTARPYTPLPGSPPWVGGLVNVRGRVVTVVDLSARLRLPAASELPGHRVVVVSSRDREVGIAVEDVLRIVRVPATEVEPLAAAEVPLGGAAFLTRALRTEQATFMAVDTDALLQPVFG